MLVEILRVDRPTREFCDNVADGFGENAPEFRAALAREHFVAWCPCLASLSERSTIFWRDVQE